MANKQNSRSRKPGKKKSGKTKKQSKLNITLSKHWAYSESDLRADLLAFTDKLNSGDESLLRGLHFSPILDIPARLKLDECEEPNYLQDRHKAGLPDVLKNRYPDGLPASNSFVWWDRNSSVPISGPISNDFECQFTPALATVVGSQVRGGHARQVRPEPDFYGFHTIPWDTGDLQTPNEVPGIEFAIRVKRPESNPVLREVTYGSENPTLLINEALPDPQLDVGEEDKNKLRPSIWIDFATPQRAVGIEYGYQTIEGQEGHVIFPSGVKLIAYDEDKNMLDGPDGRALHSRGWIPAGNVLDHQSKLESAKFNNRIGVKDRQGRIRTIELRFDYDRYDTEDQHDMLLERNPQWDAGNKILEPQTIYRIWHEALPPAAVKQGIVVQEFHPPDPGNPDAPPATPAELTLPFRCNRALTMMRGFKLEFLDQEAHEIAELGAHLSGQTYFEVERGGNISINADGSLFTREPSASGGFGEGRIGGLPSFFGPGSPAYRVSIYYTVLAWDTDQVELYMGETQHRKYTNESDPVHRVILPDPCPASRKVGPWSANPYELCGPLFGGLQGFNFNPIETQEVDNFRLDVGAYPSRLNGINFSRDESLVWVFEPHFVGDDSDGHELGVRGTVLSGRSLRVIPDVEYEPEVIPYLASLYIGPRSSPEDFIIPWQRWRDWGRSWRWPETSRVDVAFLSVNFFSFHPDGPIRELEIELKGKYHDGSVVDWQLGGGMSVVTPPDSEETGKIFIGTPTFGGVRRKHTFARRRLVSSALEFDTLVGVRSTANRLGMIRNVGDSSALLTGFRKGTLPVDDLFDYIFYWNNELYSIDEMANFLPIQLQPGQTMLLSAYYTPTAVAGVSSDVLPNIGLLEVRTNAHNGPVYVSSIGVARPNPGGAWQPPLSLNFGTVPVGETKTLLAALVNTGHTPLIVNDFYLSDENKGFSFSLTPIGGIEADAVHLQVSYTGSTSDLRGVSTLLRADTNAGLIDLRLTAAAGPAPR